MSSAKMTLIGMNIFCLNMNDDLFKNLTLPAPLAKSTLTDNILMQGGEFEVMYANPSAMQSLIGIWSRKMQPTFKRWTDALAIEYAPLENYDRNEYWHDVTDEDTTGHNVENSTDTTESSHQIDTTGRQITDFSENGTTSEDGETTTSASSNTTDSSTTERTGSGTTSASGSHSETSEHLKSAYDESSYSPYEKTINDGSNSESSQTSTSETVETESTGSSTTEGEGTSHNEGTSHKEGQTVVNSTGSETGSNNSETVGELTSNSTGTRDNDFEHEGRIHGNIGVTSSQELLLQELSLGYWNVYEKITELFLQEFTIPVYE